MKYLVVAIGSYGDLLPALAIARELTKAGHEAAIVTSGNFAGDVRQAGLEMIEVMPAEDWKRVVENPNLWHPRRSVPLFLREVVLACMPRLYDIVSAHDDGSLAVVAPFTAIGARIAQEKHGTPLATIHFAPFTMRSIDGLAPRPLDGLAPAWVGNALKNAFRAGEDFLGDTLFGAQVNEYRASLGLSRVRSVFRDWCMSPQLELCLFPRWFIGSGVPVPDHVRFATFPLHPGSGELSPALQAFLDGGSPPILFTLGSAMAHGESIFEAAIKACEILGERGLIVSRHTPRVTQSVPDTILQVDFAPFEVVVPRVKAIAYNGGIGTCSQALRAGVPQLVLPLTTDQPDNARRLKMLGVAEQLPPSRCTARSLANALQGLLASPDREKSLSAVQDRIISEPPFSCVVGLLGELASRSASTKSLAALTAAND